MNPVKIDTECDLADILTESLVWDSYYFRAGTFYGRWSPLDDVDMKQVKLWMKGDILDWN